ncbi:hypothetical protein BW733_07090 [Tessaracoccus flavescens]|uniref:Uncharacterized protein n=1 Tax=Tessaracoccus flavescens TaxID=399497 RepID=A0A1Q2CX26_9ACTN|nr:hypothetical protein BW733_07090 [Tessaracoccus flavescens]
MNRMRRVTPMRLQILRARDFVFLPRFAFAPDLAMFYLDRLRPSFRVGPGTDGCLLRVVFPTCRRLACRRHRMSRVGAEVSAGATRIEWLDRGS